MMKLIWTHEELLLAFNLYCKLPFGQFDHRNLEIIALSKLINRTPSAVAMKLSNFASFDPVHKSRGVKGLSNTSKADEAAWNEFTSNWDKTVWDSEVLLTSLKEQQTIELDEVEVSPIKSDDDFILGIPTVGETQIEQLIKVRVGQQFFRRAILANYRSNCCICGMSIPQLLIASHIIPWRDRGDLRLNPHNGLCLCALHDRAFDAGLLTVNELYTVIVSNRVADYLPNESVEMNLTHYHGDRIALPDKFTPDQSFLKYHADTYFS